MAKFGFIGIGNMGGAIARAVCTRAEPADILVAAQHPERAAAFSEEYGTVPSDNLTIAREAKFVILGVKPQYMEAVLAELKPVLEVRTDCVLVTMAAGLTMQNIANMVGGGYPVIRIMPNTPARIGKGVILYDANDRVQPEDLAEFLAAMANAGMLDRLPERLIDAGSAVSGSGPAFVAMFLEAMADAGVACGLPRAQALEYAAQTAIGTAELMLATHAHPGAMKDAVCSPGGSTIQGVRMLEQGGFRSAILEAVIATWAKNKEFIK
ncbi:MAG: pyrroline-5-carboxylate reductase [Oscillospiraceae bacterium]|nr:pyrroline-5-carboxylate reductase [Oscillospiraceae bacterium]